MLELLYKKGYLNYNKLISDHCKILGLGSDEAFILMKLLDNYDKYESLCVDKLKDQLLMSTANIDKIVVSLMERGYYEVYLAYDDGVGKECVSFQPLFEKIEAVLNQKVDLDAYDIEKANQYLASKLNRVLTANELEILQGFMLEDHYSYEEIVAATELILKENRVLSMRTLTIGLAQAKQNIKVRTKAPDSFKDFVKKI